MPTSFRVPRLHLSLASLLLVAALLTGCAGLGASQGPTYQLSTDDAIDLVEEALVRTGFTRDTVIDRMDGDRARVSALLERDRAGETGGSLWHRMAVVIEPAEEGYVRIHAEETEQSGGSFAGQSGSNHRRSFYRTLEQLIERA